MAVKKWYEVTCDNCGCAEHFQVGVSWKAQAREVGWLITAKGEAYCDKECKKKAKDKKIIDRVI